MTGRPRLAIHFFLTMIIAMLSFACVSDKVSSPAAVGPTPPVSAVSAATAEQQKSTDFNGDKAFAHVKAQVEFGPRPAGSAALDKTRDYILKELKSYGLKTTVDEFTPVTPKGRIKMKNIVAELPGESSGVIIISSHYDTKEYKQFKFLGANDGGSSTGALLEIARVMAAEKNKRKFTYQFVFFDGEEAFCPGWDDCLDGKDNTYGSRHMVDRLQSEGRVDNIKAMILLDMIGDKDLVIAKESSSSSWLVEAIWSSARKAGYGQHFPARDQYITDDHIPFLEAGIPAVDLIDFDYEDQGESFWHTKNDTLDKISSKSLKIVGDVVLLSLDSIEALIKD